MAYTITICESQEPKEEETTGAIRPVTEKKIFEQTVPTLNVAAVIKAVNGMHRKDRKK